ncbi:MAG: ketoacyl-ACP synthase III [Bacteroidales bacterium]|nr:ketoacyl-ACP synthase III [Bacteroidales bacterium]
MNISKACRITGTGKYLPGRIVSSVEMEEKLGLPSGWIERFSGVRERHVANGETNAEMAVNAINQALKIAGISADDIDLLISASVTFDYILPFQAALILDGLQSGRTLNTPAMDVNTSCLSFLTALDIASNLLDGKKYSNIVVVSSEVATKGLNEEDKEVFTLFGDGAAAAILSYDESMETGVVKSMIKTYTEGFYYSIIKGGGNVNHIKYHKYDPRIDSFTMEGKKLLRLAKDTLPQYFSEFFSDLDISINDVDVIVAHQASKAGLEGFRHIYPNLKGELYYNLDTHGNCIAASIPMCLHDAIEAGVLKRGHSCMLAGTAAGFAVGSMLIKY